MNERNDSNERNASGIARKNADPKKLADKIGPANKNNREVNVEFNRSDKVKTAGQAFKKDCGLVSPSCFVNSVWKDAI